MGYLVTVLLVAVPAYLAVAAPRRTAILARLSFLAGVALNELPLYPALWLVGATALAAADGTLASPVGLVAATLALLAVVALGVVLRRGLAARPALAAALDRDGFPAAAARVRRAAPLRTAGTLLAPFVATGRGLARRTDVAYGPDDARNLLDVHRGRRPSDDVATGRAPVLVHLHGGSYSGGRKDRDARLLVQRFARGGWVAVSATYRLRPAAGMPEHLADLEAVLAWVADHADELGADPERVVLAGSSAGAHLAAVGALRGSGRAGRVSAVVGLYGYYGPYWGGGAADGSPTDPTRLAGPDAPPFVVVHGDADTLVPPTAARRLVERLRTVSRQPVVHAELPGAQHGFDVFRSPRMLAVVDAVEAVVTELVGGAGGTQGSPARRRPGRPRS